jgi:hypothetical protein
MSTLEECLRVLEVPKEIEYEMLSFTEKERYKICIAVERGYEVIVNASMFDKDTLKKLIDYLNEKEVQYEVINQ